MCIHFNHFTASPSAPYSNILSLILPTMRLPSHSPLFPYTTLFRSGLFDIFESTLFTAIFVLLTISLIGCILPRSFDHYKAMKTPPGRAPKRLDRMPLHATGTIDQTVDQVTDHARRLLKRWKTAEYTPQQDRTGVFSISAERGYTRELANLVFHLSLVGMLATIAAGRMVYYEGMVIVFTDSGNYESVNSNEYTQFCNTSPANFDSFQAGPMFDGTGLTPFCFE